MVQIPGAGCSTRIVHIQPPGTRQRAPMRANLADAAADSGDSGSVLLRFARAMRPRVRRKHIHVNAIGAIVQPIKRHELQLDRRCG